MKTKVALVICQSYRTLERCAPSILNLIDTSVHDVDVILHTWEDELTEEKKQLFLQLLGPKKHRFDKLFSHIDPHSSLSKLFELYSTKLNHIPKFDHVERRIQHLLAGTFSLIRASHFFNHAEYDYVVFTRPDIEYRTTQLNLDVLNIQDNEVILPGQEQHRGWNSQMAILKSSDFAVYSALYCYMINTMPTDDGAAMNHEMIIQRWLEHHNQFTRRMIPIEYKIIRGRDINKPYDELPTCAPRDSGDL